MNKEAVVCIYNGILLSHTRNSFESALMMWMKLEPIIQSEVSQKKKKQLLHINPYIWNLERWYWWTYLQGSNGDRYREQTYGCKEGEERVGWMERVARKHIHYCVYNSLCEFSVWIRELKPGVRDNLEAWDGVGGGREVQEGGNICRPMADSCWCMAETNTTL